MVPRWEILQFWFGSIASLVGMGRAGYVSQAQSNSDGTHEGAHHANNMQFVCEVDNGANSFNPLEILAGFDCGKASKLERGSLIGFGLGGAIMYFTVFMVNF